MVPALMLRTAFRRLFMDSSVEQSPDTTSYLITPARPALRTDDLQAAAPRPPGCQGPLPPSFRRQAMGCAPGFPLHAVLRARVDGTLSGRCYRSAPIAAVAILSPSSGQTANCSPVDGRQNRARPQVTHFHRVGLAVDLNAYFALLYLLGAGGWRRNAPARRLRTLPRKVACHGEMGGGTVRFALLGWRRVPRLRPPQRLLPGRADASAAVSSVRWSPPAQSPVAAMPAIGACIRRHPHQHGHEAPQEQQHAKDDGHADGADDQSAWVKSSGFMF